VSSYVFSKIKAKKRSSLSCFFLCQRKRVIKFVSISFFRIIQSFRLIKIRDEDRNDKKLLCKASYNTINNKLKKTVFRM
jgi:hypothetical protein